ncbi:MAG: hypothetical protein NTW98_00520 [Candidatus Nomurabacteria bacterium]|jgi:hypothetical protein|nr:hypothetical protein [Candidatus Nomurabacteria bacterium]
MFDEETNDDLLGGGGFPTDDEADLPLDDDLDIVDPDMGPMKFDEEEGSPDDKFV